MPGLLANTACSLSIIIVVVVVVVIMMTSDMMFLTTLDSDPDFKNCPSLCKYACLMTDQSLQKQLVNVCYHVFKT